ncbi:hydroxymethylbilane synthase [Compostimonas suwonensis]|uniref:Porphobilinogen deaminase n=1 Tax=Compostimonas suwonensis TaxID=1048394 RepID=A0A2M9C3Y0_9MICO|nr:hydroxymethylbilane synthase [Compostimonas suwonensis]PJJ65233.1 hydroxymethylbilane synthase [Compostimonas suwonensis]
MTDTLRIGTRGSALAVAQTQAIADRLAASARVPVELVTITTHGDTSTESLASLGGTGVFAGALREALRDGRCDLVVHSLKDLPTAPYEGLTVAAIPKRADARDALCARDGLTLDTLPEGATVGTGSPRRVAQLLARRPDLSVREVRGNVDTRLRMVAEGALDAVVLAAAGLSRLGLEDAVTEFFPIGDWPTAPGQGALALEVRSSGTPGLVTRALQAVDHATSHATATAERLVLAGLEAGCAAPVAASALVEDELFFLTATVFRPDGTESLTSSHAAHLESKSIAHLAEAAGDTSRRVVAELLAAGAAGLAPLGGTT